MDYFFSIYLCGLLFVFPFSFSVILEALEIKTFLPFNSLPELNKASFKDASSFNEAKAFPDLEQYLKIDFICSLTLLAYLLTQITLRSL